MVRGLAALPPRVLRRLVGRPVVVDGQQLHPEVQLALKLLELAGEPELGDLTVSDARARVAKDARTFEGRKLEVGRVEELQLSGAGGPVGARRYLPGRVGAGTASEGEPLLLYFHGGGFVVCDLDTHDNVCRFLCSQSEVQVISVDYRLAPEHPFPAASDDALATFRDVAARAGALGVDSRRIAVGGDSAGGNLAAGVAQSARQDDATPAFQLLLYPWLDLSEKRQSHALFREGFYLTEADLDWYHHHYLGDDGDPRDPRCSPLLTEQLDGVAPAYIATSGFDPLRDEGEEYARRLLAAGVPVALHRQAGIIHGFANTIAVGRVGREAMTQAAGALRLGLAPRREAT